MAAFAALLACGALANTIDLGSLTVSGLQGTATRTVTVYANQSLRLYFDGGLPGYLPLGPSCASDLVAAPNCSGIAGYHISSFDRSVAFAFGPNSSAVDLGRDDIVIPAGPLNITFTLSQQFSVGDPAATLPTNTLKLSLSTNPYADPGGSISLSPQISLPMPTATPEPSTCALGLLGLAGLGLPYRFGRNRALARA